MKCTLKFLLLYTFRQFDLKVLFVPFSFTLFIQQRVLKRDLCKRKSVKSLSMLDVLARLLIHKIKWIEHIKRKETFKKLVRKIVCSLSCGFLS